MGIFKFTPTGLKGLCIIEPHIFKDQRGYFMETYHGEVFAQAGVNASFAQDNQSCSTRGVLRGLHFQYRYPQGKLVRVLKGEIFDVTVDLRKDADTFGKWFGIFLSEENKKQLYVPEGFAHGFLVTSDFAEVSYKCTDYYKADDEGGILWNDPDIGIKWPLETMDTVLLSEKDKKWKRLKETPIDF